MSSSVRYIAAFLAAAVVTGALASIVQTQIVLGQLLDLGVPVTASVRAWATLQDLARFGPVMVGIVCAALLPAVLVGHLLVRVVPEAWRVAIFAIVSVAGLWAMLWLMRSVIPMPAIPGSREQLGQTLMSLTAIFAGLLYARLSRLTQPASHSESRLVGRHALTATVLLIVPVVSFLATAPGASDKPDAVDPESYKVQTVLTGMNRPWSVAFLPDGRTLVTEMDGRLLSVTADGESSVIALDSLPPIFRQGGIIGLMDVAVDPQFDQNGWLYLTMGYGQAGANGTRLVRAKLANDRVEDVRVLFSSTLKPSVGNNGGRIAFLGDGTLVLSLGDGSARREEAQNPSNYLGTVVRLDREGKPPSDNPFVHQFGTAPEIYSLGHRNPQGIAVDPATGDLLLTEHGPRGGDEINQIIPGGNYGWPIVTGGIDYPFARVTPFRRLRGYLDPVLEWAPSIAPAGLAVYDGQMFPAWRGNLLVPALKERAVRLVLRERRRVIGQQLLLADLNQRIRDVKVAPDGSIFVLTDGQGAKLLRITAAH
ncbi:TPA: PQQ-dependent sugar dehydrogenase [Pseudomonas putida]|nr:PQQ-dependent sugar dehydrogenase [Pseudomonas putida]